MSENDAPTEAPATWENVVVGKVKEAAGRVMNDDDLVEEGKEQEQAAHEVRDEYDDAG